MNLPPHPRYIREQERLTKYYAIVIQQIVSIIKDIEGETLTKRQQQAVLTQISSMTMELEKKQKEWCEDVITSVFTDAQARALISLGVVETIAEARKKVTTNTFQQQRVQAMIDDTFEDLLQATRHMDRRTKRLVRDIVAETQRVNALQRKGYDSTRHEIFNELRRQGFSKSIRDQAFVGIVDRSGRRWDLRTYSNMIAKTKIQQAQVEGARVEALEYDTDLAIISHSGAVDACRHFEGMIISLEGRTRGYRTYRELRDSNLIFHPNCQHTVHPIILDNLPPNLREIAEKARVSGERAFENPKAAISEGLKRERELKKKK